MRMWVPAKRVSTPVTLVLTLPLVGLIGWLDYETGPIAMSLLYFVPIFIAAWVGETTVALTVALVAGGSWFASEFALAQHTTNIVVWNTFTRTSTFSILALMVRLVRRDRDRLDELNASLNEALQVEARVSRTDPLTGLPNSRSFKEALERELARGRRESSAIAIGYLDLDNFKRINDSLGHEAGDDVLRRVGEALRRNIRGEDVVARLGGDEFAVLSVRPTNEGLGSVCERILGDVREIADDYPGTGFGCTLGFILFPTPPRDSVEAVHEADALMYEVKTRSKGRFEVRVSSKV